MTLTPYLLFDGTCHDAMEFYKTVFGGQLDVNQSEGFASQRPHACLPAGEDHQRATAQRTPSKFRRRTG